MMASRCIPIGRRCVSVTATRLELNIRRQYSNGSGEKTDNFFRRFTKRNYSFPANRDPGLAITSVISDPKEVEGPRGVPSRAEQLRRLERPVNDSFDILVIGGGATGAGIALDAATRGMSVACIERGDFSSETSSRSTKLIWAGIRYMATATAILLSPKLLTSPITTVKDFAAEMNMVFSCHRERRYMMEKQEHLCNWIPIAIPFTEWHVSPPPFGHRLYGFFPVLAPFVLKFYDSLSFFQCPPSYILTASKARKVFPQLEDRGIKYCAVFYEAQHNDARTNIAIAMSAAEHGAAISNYVEMINTIKDPNSGKVIGVEALDRMTGKTFEIKANKVVFAGGPFTDSLREMEQKDDIKPAVRGASGTHIVLPGYYTPNDMGLLDYNTSDGRFMFILPWENHTLIGTTDVKGPAETLPSPPEDEVEWMLTECSKYLTKDLKIRRSDVLSAWRGWRPLAVDPHAPLDAPVSRDHVISENPETGVIFIAGGKWTTWREMAEEVVDRVAGENGPKCRTLDVKLFGGEGYTKTLAIELIQKHGMSEGVAANLVKSYGSRAWEVCELTKPTHRRWPKFGRKLADNYPYIDADVSWACREYACTIEDVLSRRTRLAFLNRDAALEAIPAVADIMAKELGWTNKVKQQQIASAVKYTNSYSGRISEKFHYKLKSSKYETLRDVFDVINTSENGHLHLHEVEEVAEILGLKLKKTELEKVFNEMDKKGTGKVSYEAFEHWWNESSNSPFHRELCKELGLFGMKDEDLKEMGGGALFG